MWGRGRKPPYINTSSKKNKKALQETAGTFPAELLSADAIEDMAVPAVKIAALLCKASAVVGSPAAGGTQGRGYCFGGDTTEDNT